MFDWLSKFFADVAYDAAVNSVSVASHNGMYQMEEPEKLRKLASK